MNLIDFIKQTLERLKAYSPDYFIKLRKIAGYVTVLTFAVNYLPEAINFLGLHYQFSANMLNIISICGKISAYCVLIFGFTWLPADFTKAPKFAIGSNAWVKKTKQPVIIVNHKFDTYTDTKTGRKERNIIYVTQDEEFYEIELTDQCLSEPDNK